MIPQMENKDSDKEKKSKWAIATASRDAPLKSRPKKNTEKDEKNVD